MRICLISTALYSPNLLSGVEVYVRNLSRQLVKRGHQISVITTSPQSSTKASMEEINGVRVYSFRPLHIYERSESQGKPLFMKLVWHGFDLLWNQHSYMVIRGILKKERPDVVHIHTFRGLSPSVFSAVKSLNISLVFTVHDYSLICPRSSLLKNSIEVCDQPRLVCKLYKALKALAVGSKPDLVTVNTDFMIRKYKEHGFFSNVRFEKFPITTFAVGDGSAYRDSETLDVLFAGQLGKFKGVQILINAFKQLGPENLRLHIAGTGPDAPEFEKMAADDSRIVFYGALPWEQLMELYKKANLAVVPSVFYEPYGFAVLESFRSGTPVVASNIGGIPELIEDGYNGRLFEAGNVAELKNILENLLESPLELKRLGEGALESAKKYDIEQHVTDLVALYEELIARTPLLIG